jgi:hypothetical protein
VILQRHTVFDTWGDFNPETGMLRTFSKKSASKCGPTSGLFDYLGETLVILYRLDDNLYLLVGNRQMQMADHVIEIDSSGGRRIFRVIAGDATVLELAYDQPIIDPPLSEDWTQMVEEDHFDFGLFLANLSRDHIRQSHMYVDEWRRFGIQIP